MNDGQHTMSDDNELESFLRSERLKQRHKEEYAQWTEHFDWIAGVVVIFLLLGAWVLILKIV